MKLQRHIRLDFTPLVDIALILVLAYMAILYHQKSKVLSMSLPKHFCGPIELSKNDGTSIVSLFLFENHIVYIDGYDEVGKPFYKADYSLASFGNIIKPSKKGDRKVAIIKPRNSSTYGDLVAVINHCKRFNIKYVLVTSFTQDEEQMLSQAEKMFFKSL